MLNPYIGHPSQLAGVEETRLVGGKGDGMRLLSLWNEAGLSMTVAPDRCADIYRLRVKGDNLGYFSPCGYVAPQFYDAPEKGFLKSFTAGFLTTCGLENCGAPRDFGGQRLPLHGSIGNTPAQHVWWQEEEDSIRVHAEVSDQVLFGRKLLLRRTLTLGKRENTLLLEDTVENLGDSPEAVMLMYHINMGYPLLSETAKLQSNASRVMLGEEAVPEETWKRMEPPRPRTPEICYRQLFEDRREAAVSLENPAVGRRVEMTFDPERLPCLIQWSLFSHRDYALGLEPRSFYRPAEAAENPLQPGEKREYWVKMRFF